MNDYANLVPQFAERLRRLVESCGLSITSGYRSPERQRQLYEDYLAGRGNPANPPGTSNHEFGLAADLAGNLDCAHAAAAAVGIIFPIAGEPWHAQPREVTSPRYTGNPFPLLQTEDNVGVFNGSIEPGKSECIPLVPPGGGASGGGYEDNVYVSCAVDNFGQDAVKIRWALVGDGSSVIDAKDDVVLPTGRTLICIASKPAAGAPWPNSISITNKDKTRPVSWMCEWARP